MLRRLGLAVLLVGFAITAMAQTPPAVPPIVSSQVTVDTTRTPSTASNVMQYVILGSALFGAFMKRWTDEDAHTRSKATVMYVLVTGGVTYLAMDSGMLPDTWITAATNNPLKAGVVSFLLSSIAGAGLVTALQAATEKITAAIKA